ncbi:MAG: PD40 domain-containing protein [Cytophagaceae bacterium]|nr:PD40 domain-containing protein [Cytophagaceae bacterium]
MRIIITLFCFYFTLVLAVESSAQSLSRDGKKYAKEAREYFEAGSYAKALEFYLLVEKTDEDNIGILYSIAICYVNTFQADKALPYLNRVRNSSINDPKINYYYGVAYQSNHQFDEAVKHYNMFLQNEKDEEERRKVKHYIVQCTYGKELMAKPVKITVENLGKGINTQHAEYTPAISADEHAMFFTSRRENSTGGEKDPQDNQFYEDIYTSTKVQGKWTTATHLNGDINSASHDACVGLSSDGQMMFIYKTENGGDLYISELKGAQWSTPVVFAEINSEFFEPCAAFSADGNTVIVVSDRPGGFGGTDLYLSRKNADGSFSKPKNLGPKFNTEYNELSPFIHSDGKTLSFSSEGHKGMGGYDIFSVGIDLATAEAKGDPKNEGYPINTAGDEIYFVWSADNRRAYFSSSRDGGMGDKDLYVLELPEAEARLVVFTGTVVDCETKKPIEATISMVDNTTQKKLESHKSNSSTGKYVVVLPAGKNYGISIEAPEYAFYSKNIDIPDLKNFKEISDEVCLQNVKAGTKIVLRNVFFDIDKATLRKESENELNKLTEVLQQNPGLSIEISGHTDSDGEAQHNTDLSQARAQAVYDYLVSKSVAKEKMRYKGYGELKPVVNNDSPENKQLNRRTEIEFLK